MADQLHCTDGTRREVLRDRDDLNGIDYLEVLDRESPPGTPRQRTLLVRFLNEVGVASLARENVRVDGGVRVTGVEVTWVVHAADEDLDQVLAAEPGLAAHLRALPDAGEVLAVRTDRRGDASPYALRLVDPGGGAPPAGFDPRLARVAFSFQVECPTDLDCGDADGGAPARPPGPRIDYLAKDYASFRRLLLDRMSLLMPGWTERSPASLDMTLVELLAFTGDRLSYFQDSVAGEAYLGTARRRTSVRRHARLLDYSLHEGHNARAWVTLEVEPGGGADGAWLPRGTAVLARPRPAGPGRSGPTLAADEVEEAVRSDAIVFEARHSARLRALRNAVDLHAWGNRDCCLPEGATSATLASAGDLELARGDLLVFEEAFGRPLRDDDEDLRHHVVRLEADPRAVEDDLRDGGQVLVEVRWAAADALPFPLCVRKDGEVGGRVRANVVLVDQGLTRYEAVTTDGSPLALESRIVHGVPFDADQARLRPAADLTDPDPRRALPAVKLHEIEGLGTEDLAGAAGELGGDGDGEDAPEIDGEAVVGATEQALATATGRPTPVTSHLVRDVIERIEPCWLPKRDLLKSGRFERSFVVEVEDGRRPTLRFGDGINGRRPSGRMLAVYRTGLGAGGNVGPGSLRQVLTDLTGIVAVSNPLAAFGGADPEDADEARRFAPVAFQEQRRAVTAEDYGRVATEHPAVQRAAATRRWTGSWYTMFVTADRRGGTEVDAPYEEELRRHVEPYRLAGHDLEVSGPQFVSLRIALTVCVEGDVYAAHVHRDLLAVFGTGALDDGRLGFFHPDNFTFAQPVYLSHVVATAMDVPGVRWAKPTVFERQHEAPGTELADGRIALGRLEIARCDSDPNALENGRVEFDMEGGL